MKLSLLVVAAAVTACVAAVGMLGGVAVLERLDTGAPPVLLPHRGGAKACGSLSCARRTAGEVSASEWASAVRAAKASRKAYANATGADADAAADASKWSPPVPERFPLADALEDPCAGPAHAPLDWSEELAFRGAPPACFNHTRCAAASAGGPLSVYVYPNTSDAPDYFWRERRQYRIVLRELRRLGEWGGREVRLVEDPDEACLLFPNVDPSCEHNVCGDHVPDRLARLPHWNGGRNHVLWELSDWDAPRYQTGHALLWRTNFARRTYRPGRDVAFPLLPFYNKVWEYPEPNERRGAATRARPPEERPLLASFKGQLPHLMDNPRHALRALNDSRIPTHFFCCKSRWCQPWTVDCDALNATRYTIDFDGLLADSKFLLVPRGYGLHSYRLWEALHAGAVPVVLADGWVLPFEDDADWASAALVVPEGEIPRLPALLRAVEAEPGRLRAMQAAGSRLFDRFLVDRRAMLREALLTVLRRLRCAGACGAASGLRVSHGEGWTPPGRLRMGWWPRQV